MVTLSNIVTISGRGLHSGQSVDMVIEPSDTPGIRFLFESTTVPVNISVLSNTNIRATMLCANGATIQTPEHFLSAAYALQLTAIDARLSHNELPILDGSSAPFIAAIQPMLTPYNGPAPPPLRVTHILKKQIGISQYEAKPYCGLIIHCSLDYSNHWIGTMSYCYVHNTLNYHQSIAPARTYGFEDEIDTLTAKGLIKGGSLDNALVITSDGYLNTPRFPDELVRHKILDFLGDMAISGRELQGEFHIHCPSHHGNALFLNTCYDVFG